MELIVVRVFENLLLPPGINMVMLVVGALIISRHYRTGISLILIGFFTFVILSFPISGYILNLPNQHIKPISNDLLHAANTQAIIVLGGGRYRNAPEYNKDTVSTSSLSRIRYAAMLHRKTTLPILVTGGVVFGTGLSEAKLMQQSLLDDFKVNTKWTESKSRNTKENAFFSYQLLKKHKISNIILITDVSHITRAKAIFEKTGFTVIPAAINFDTEFNNIPLMLSLIPTLSGLNKSHSVLREYLGQLWYFLRY